MRTFQLLFGGGTAGAGVYGPESERGSGETAAGIPESMFGGGDGSIVVTEEIREWEYGEYEGLLKREVKELRRQRGLEQEGREWSVWRDGCEGGE